ncbi:hypothetical protein [Desulfopila inferna]|uniref:hypothetical protein n=1 Tax=Desulfopila inferna TaxID=468528 RepID=UPI0019644495|nr:hypothetical protein [Desulfopila inferna]MBM9605784.1 hypothetical protein [Desulfopila inferna]
MMEKKMSKKKWIAPHMEVVTLEHDKDVLALCSTPSDSRQSTSSADNYGCTDPEGTRNCPAK